MRGYGGFGPVAKAAEIFAKRWTPLIVRELVAGSHRFNELERGLPGISHSLLSQRLRSLERPSTGEPTVACLVRSLLFAGVARLVHRLAAVQPQRDGVGLRRRAARRRVRGLPAGDRHQHLERRILLGRRARLGPHDVLRQLGALLQHLEVVEHRVLAQDGVAQRPDQRRRIVAERQVAVRDGARLVDAALLLAVVG
ncbi:MAG: helix-turn-helix transcriptional regulator [Chloroflexi bacterium]|nr:helix-turn-helix transcriptional regulator [Chloroflexota bacterium]